MRLENSFGETVKKLREEKNLPLRKVAEALDIDTSMLGKIEKNSRKPSKSLIEKFSKFFNVSDKDLTIVFLSDAVANRVLDKEEIAREVFKVAEKKVKYFKINKNS